VSSTEPEKPILSGPERELATRLSENPMDLFQGKTVGWLEDFIRITVGGGSGSSDGSGSSGTSAAYYVPGDLKVVINDLTAQTGEYVYSDDSGQWLYCNGVAVSQTTYADLYATVGANAFGTDSGGNFFLPDPRGRALFFTGTHTNADLGDNDGVAVASRTAKHSHTNGVTGSITGAPGVGSLAVNPSTHTHSFTAVLAATAGISAAGGQVGPEEEAGSTTGSSTTLSISGAPSAGTLGVSVGGTVGTGTPVDTPAHLFIGSLLVRF
jgi:microcystin-dependent protein